MNFTNFINENWGNHNNLRHFVRTHGIDWVVSVALTDVEDGDDEVDANELRNYIVSLYANP